MRARKVGLCLQSKCSLQKLFKIDECLRCKEETKHTNSAGNGDNAWSFVFLESKPYWCLQIKGSSLTEIKWHARILLSKFYRFYSILFSPMVTRDFTSVLHLLKHLNHKKIKIDSHFYSTKEFNLDIRFSEEISTYWNAVVENTIL